MNSTLTNKQIAGFRERLNGQRIELLQEIREELLRSEHEHYVDLANQVHDIGDESVADLLSDISLAVIDHYVHEVQDIEAALGRIDAGSFGVCINCGSEIEVKRLDAYPTAKRCYICQRRYEQTRSNPGHASL
jgi:RNA polymerase-binding protein DksA